jgi:hypothetical protein
MGSVYWRENRKNFYFRSYQLHSLNQGQDNFFMLRKCAQSIPRIKLPRMDAFRAKKENCSIFVSIHQLHFLNQGEEAFWIDCRFETYISASKIAYYKNFYWQMRSCATCKWLAYNTYHHHAEWPCHVNPLTFPVRAGLIWFQQPDHNENRPLFFFPHLHPHERAALDCPATRRRTDNHAGRLFGWPLLAQFSNGAPLFAPSVFEQHFFGRFFGLLSALHAFSQPNVT